jgi:hypothetical protein
VHDRIYVIARNRPPFVGVQFLAWMVPYFFIAAVLVLVLANPILLTYRRFRRESALAGAGATLFVTGGVVFEILSHYVLYAVGDAGWPFLLTVAAEEFCEMTGVTLMLYAFLRLGLRMHCDRRPPGAS